MINQLQDDEWKNLLSSINNCEVIPVVGPGVVTFGQDDELLYPWLVKQVPMELDLSLELVKPPCDLKEIADALRMQGLPIDRIHRCLANIIKFNPDLWPGSTLAALASIEGFKLFISTTFDPLLLRAVKSASPGGKDEDRRGAASKSSAWPDLPEKLDSLEYRFVYQILGYAESALDFAVLDDDTFSFLLKLKEQYPHKLISAFREKDFLMLGLNFSDCLLRFFINFIKCSERDKIPNDLLKIFPKIDPKERDNLVIYFNRMKGEICVLQMNPLEFIRELHMRWRQKHPAPIRSPYAQNKEYREIHSAPGCIFVSYASPDIDTARHIVNQLQKGGCFVWFDKDQLQPGEFWDIKLREAIVKRCGLFLSLISKTTADQVEKKRYFIEERECAVERSRRDPSLNKTVFYIPIRIDEGDLIPENEPCGKESVQGFSCLQGYLKTVPAEYFRDLQHAYCEKTNLLLPDKIPIRINRD